MGKRHKKPNSGVPEWVVTFGDMMSLLLCFFILLQMFSELKREHEYQRVITAIKDAFGYSGGVGVLPVDDLPTRSVIETLERLALKTLDTSKLSQSPDEAIEGKHLRVRKIREGLIFTIGGPTSFDEFSAEIKPHVHDELKKLAVILDGRTNKIVIRGHATAKYIPADSPWVDLDQLSFARARNIKDVLLELGLDDRAFRLEAVGIREPLRSRIPNAQAAAENRRVEIILTEELVEESNTDSEYTDPDIARGS